MKASRQGRMRRQEDDEGGGTESTDVMLWLSSGGGTARNRNEGREVESILLSMIRAPLWQVCFHSSRVSLSLLFRTLAPWNHDAISG